jgi:Fe2+ transport system protein FeoA
MEDGSAEPALALRPLASLRGGEGGVVRRIAHEDHDLLASLTALGVGLGSRVLVRGDAVEGEDVAVELDGTPQRIAQAAAEEVLVETSAP